MADGKLGWRATLWAGLFRPKQLLEAVRTQRVTPRPVLVYALGLCSTGAGFGVGVALTSGQSLLGMVLLWSSFVLVLTPVYWYADAGFVHLVARLFGGKGSFADTKAAIGYSAVPRLFGFVPIVAIVFEGWALVLRVFALCALHRLRAWRGVLVVLSPLLVAIGVAVSLRAFVIEAFKVPSGSMFPSIEMGDHLFVSKANHGTSPKTPAKRGDVVAFLYPDPNPSAEPVDYLKRVIGLPNDELVFEAGVPVINGWHVPRCRLGEAKVTLSGFEDEQAHEYEVFVEFLESSAYLVAHDHEHQDGVQGPYRVKPGELWVVGDNRNNSSDSRAWNGGQGAGVPFENAKGHARWLWLPTARLGIDLAGPPVLPQNLKQLEPELKRCLAEAPELARRTPPAPK